MNKTEIQKLLKTKYGSENKKIHKYLLNNSKDEKEYKDNLYHALMLNGSTKKANIEKIYGNYFGLNDEIFEIYRNIEKEENDFITNPLVVEEGVLECECGSKRTMSYSKQTRGGDEATSVFAQCVECGRKWRAFHNILKILNI